MQGFFLFASSRDFSFSITATGGTDGWNCLLLVRIWASNENKKLEGALAEM